MSATLYTKSKSPITNLQAFMRAMGFTSIATTVEAAIVQFLQRLFVVTTYTADGAIALTPGVHVIAKATAAAMTIAAPSSGIDGARLLIVANTDAAHVITFTGATLLDGTTGANLTVTLTAFKGSAIVIVAVGTKWLLQSSSNVTSITA